MGNTYTCIHLHVIFSTKDRRPWLKGDIKTRLYQYISGIIRGEREILIAIGGAADHVHLLISLRPDRTLSDLMRMVKANSSKWLHETFSDLADFAWQEGYGAFAVSRSNAHYVQNYINNQEEHHRKMSFREEFTNFLRKHEIEFEEQYLKA